MCPCFADERASLLTGDGHEEETLPEVRGTDPRSAQIRRPDGVTRALQISENNVEPLEAIRTCNLLANDDWRAALLDEPEPRRPEVALVVEALPAPRLAERLAGAASRPDRGVVGPAGEAERVGPDADAGEEVRLPELADVGRLEGDDAPVVDFAGRDVPGFGEVLEPRGRVRIVFVVEDIGQDQPLCSARF
jgi:hypothetical protein